MVGSESASYCTLRTFLYICQNWSLYRYLKCNTPAEEKYPRIFLLQAYILKKCENSQLRIEVCFVNFYLLPIVIITFQFSTASTYTCLYRFVKYRVPNQLLGFKHNNHCPNLFWLLYKLCKIKHRQVCPTNGSYHTWLCCYHCIPCHCKVPSATAIPYNTSYSCHHPSSNYSQDYMINKEFPAYFLSMYNHQFPSTKLKQNPRCTSDSSGTPTTYTPTSNPNYPNLHYYNKKKRYYFDKTTIHRDFHHQA